MNPPKLSSSGEVIVAASKSPKSSSLLSNAVELDAVGLFSVDCDLVLLEPVLFFRLGGCVASFAVRVDETVDKSGLYRIE